MSRFTKRFDGKVKMVGCAYDCKRCDGMDCTYPAIAIEKLCHYEDLEEQGRLIVLPCKVGDTVWLIEKDFPQYPPIKFKFSRKSDIMREMEKGMLFYATKEEAEAKLAELNGELK